MNPLDFVFKSVNIGILDPRHHFSDHDYYEAVYADATVDGTNWILRVYSAKAYRPDDVIHEISRIEVPLEIFDDYLYMLRVGDVYGLKREIADSLEQKGMVLLTGRITL